MNKTYLYSLATLSFCSSFLDFMILQEGFAVFPRDRILHIIISFILFGILSVLLGNIDFKKGVLQKIIILAVTMKLVYTIFAFAEYFRTYHGLNIFGILLLTAAISFFVCRLTYSQFGQLYSFFAVGNIVLIVMMIVLGLDKINVANIYANSLEFSFSFVKLSLFFEVLTISAITEKGRERIYVQRRYLMLTAFAYVIVVFLQGFCVNGNMLYSIAPMQSLFQIYSGVTVRRFDYVFTVLQSINYFAMIMLYVWTIKCVCKKETIVEKS